MQNWVKMLESLLDRQKASQPSIANTPVEQLSQRDSSAVPSQQMYQGTKLQQGGDSQLQTLLNQYPQISETFKPVEEFLANYTQMQSAYYGNGQKMPQNTWSNNQYQTNPVYPYDQGSYETNNYMNYFGNNNNRNSNNNNNNNVDMNSMNNNNYEVTTPENNPVNEYFMQTKDNNGEDGKLVSSLSPTPSPQTYLTPIQAYSTQAPPITPAYAAARQTNAYPEAITSRGSENVAMPTEKKVRPWPTPRPFQYNLDLLKIYQERVLEKQLEEERRQMQKPTVQHLVNLPTTSFWKSNNGNNAKEGARFNSQMNWPQEKHLPNIRIAPFTGRTEEKDTRIHPWPFALRIKVIPPDGGNYIMRIKGPLDTLAGSHPKFDVGQGRSKGIANTVQGNQMAEQNKYIPPLNRNYKLSPYSYQNQNPIVYLKVPRNHQKFIELTTSFPNKEATNSDGQLTSNRGKVVSLKLPFNVSLATVLKNIYENMFVNYLNKKPSQIIDEERQYGMARYGEHMAGQFYDQRIENTNGNVLRKNDGNLGIDPRYNSFFKTRKADLEKFMPNPKPFLAAGGWKGGSKNVAVLPEDRAQRKKESTSFSKMNDYVKDAPLAKVQSVRRPLTNAAFNQKLSSRNGTAVRPGSQSQFQNSLRYKQFKTVDWKSIYQKLKSKISGNQKAKSQEKQNAPPRFNQLLSSKPGANLGRKDSAMFPESIKLRLYPQGNLKLNQVTQNLLSSMKNAGLRGRPGESANFENLKKKYYAELVIKNPVQKSGFFDKKSYQQWPLSQGPFGNKIKKSNEMMARMLPFQRSIMPINALVKQQLPQQIQNRYQLSQPLIRQPVSLSQIQNPRSDSVKNIKTSKENQYNKNLIQTKSAQFRQAGAPATITFRQMQIPYKYLVNPVKLGSRWRLVPVTTNTVEKQRSQLINPALRRESMINMKGLPSQNKVNIPHSLPQVIDNRKELLTPRQIYENQIKLLRHLQRDLSMRKSEESALVRSRLLQKQDKIQQQRQSNIQTGDDSAEITQLSANISPIKMVAAKPLLRQGKLGSPLMDKLMHGLPNIKKTEGKRPGFINGEKYKQNVYVEEGKTQRKDQEQRIPEEEMASTTKGKPIIVTEVAQTRTVGLPAPTMNKDESESSKILTKFLEETSPSSEASVLADDWDKRKSIPGKMTDSDIVSKSVIPEMPKAPLSDHEIIKEREHHLQNRLVRLKRKRIDSHVEARTELQRSKRL